MGGPSALRGPPTSRLGIYCDRPFIPRYIAAAIPVRRIVRSTAVPVPSKGGIDNNPVKRETTPVPPSMRTKGREKTANDFVVGRLPFCPFHGDYKFICNIL